MTARVQDLLSRWNSLLADGGPYQVDTVRPRHERASRWFAWFAILFLCASFAPHVGGIL